MADGKFTQNTLAAMPRKANEYFASVKHLRPQEKLFDGCWSEGEVTLFFGPSRTGKSIFAVQLAEAIARGNGIDGFGFGAKRKKVLYVDLKLTDRQFAARYTNEGKEYKFSENLYRQKPPKDERLIEWLRKMVSQNGFRVIVMDDISAVKTTYDGTREMLKLMRELRDLRDEFDLSILVLAGAQEQRRGELISESHMLRSRVLCDLADSCFAIGVHAGNPLYRYFTQTRTLSSAVKWQGNDMPVCSIQRAEDGFLRMEFDERFVAEIDEETRRMICEIKWRRDAGASWRNIAEELGIATSTAFRLRKKWNAALEKDLVVEPESTALPLDLRKSSAFPSGGNNGSGGYASGGGEAAQNPITADGEAELRRTSNGEAAGADGTAWSAIPFLAALKRLHVTDLKHGVDGYGREIFIEKEYEYNGKPIRWYQYDAKGNLYRKERDSWGIDIKRLESPWIQPVHDPHG